MRCLPLLSFIDLPREVRIIAAPIRNISSANNPAVTSEVVKNEDKKALGE